MSSIRAFVAIFDYGCQNKELISEILGYFVQFRAGIQLLKSALACKRAPPQNKLVPAAAVESSSRCWFKQKAS